MATKTIEETLAILDQMLESLGAGQPFEDEWLTGARDTVGTVKYEILNA